jgi:hypothetical protein
MECFVAAAEQQPVKETPSLLHFNEKFQGTLGKSYGERNKLFLGEIKKMNLRKVKRALRGYYLHIKSPLDAYHYAHVADRGSFNE